MKAIIEDDKLLIYKDSKFYFWEIWIWNLLWWRRIRRIKTNEYDLIIVDSILPKVNAIKLLKKLKRMGS